MLSGGFIQDFNILSERKTGYNLTNLQQLFVGHQNIQTMR